MHPRMRIEKEVAPYRLFLRLDERRIYCARRAEGQGYWVVTEVGDARFTVGCPDNETEARAMLERLAECEEEYLDT